MLHPEKASVKTPAEAARAAKRALMRLARPVGEFDARRYFRGTLNLGFYNVGAPAVRSLAKAIDLDHRGTWSIDDAMRFADVLIADRHLEAKGVAVEVVARYRRAFTPALLTRWKRWLAQGSASNWATTDSICGMLVGPLTVRHPALAAKVAAWSRDPSVWVRRASAVGLIASLRQKRGLHLAYRVATQLCSDREDLIQKAVGWMLREAGKADPARLERFLQEGGPSLPRVTVRYAIERFPESRRRELLTATRGKRPVRRPPHRKSRST